MSLDVESLEGDARERTGLDDFGDGSHREGLERLVASLNEEAELTETGEVMLRIRLVGLLESRLRVEDTYRAHPSIDAERVEGTRLRHRPAAHGHDRLEPARGG